MRAYTFTVAVVALLVSLAAPAQARCSSGGKDICATENGHYRIRLPSGLGPYPTVVYLYGSTGNSGEIVNNDTFIQAFLSRGYAVIVPAALDVRYADGVDSGWHLRHERGAKPRDEIAFIAEVLEDAATNHLIDRRRVLMAGMSRGGFLTWEIACHRPDLAQAYAPVAAGYLGPMPARCQAPVRLLHTHGRSDIIVPLSPDRPWYSGGARMHGLEDALARMAKRGGCTVAGPPVRANGFERTDWQDCGDGASTGLLIHGGGHTIPFSWYGTVIDWFEKGTAKRPAAISQGGGTAVFRSTRDRASQGGSAGGRFKKAPSAQ